MALHFSQHVEKSINEVFIMRYFLKRIYKPKKVVITDEDKEISEQEFLKIRQANIVLKNARALEEIYEIVVIAYKDFEKKIFEFSLNNMIYIFSNHEDLSNTFISINAKLLNLLSSVTMYTDQSVHYVKNCFFEVENLNNLESFFTTEYDNNIEYQFMEALRNYVQHRGLPTHLVKYPSRWTSIDEDGLLEYSLEFSSFKDRLMKDKKMKKKVLINLGDEIDLKMSTRSYVESISNIHYSLRQIIKDSVTDCRNIIETIHNDYIYFFKGRMSSVQACKIDGQKLVESVPLLLEWDDIRIKLQKKNRKLTNLKKCYVTSAIKRNS